MSSRELIHSVSNQLTVVINGAELVRLDPSNVQMCDLIKSAAIRINDLLRQFETKC